MTVPIERIRAGYWYARDQSGVKIVEVYPHSIFGLKVRLFGSSFYFDIEEYEFLGPVPDIWEGKWDNVS